MYPPIFFAIFRKQKNGYFNLNRSNNNIRTCNNNNIRQTYSSIAKTYGISKTTVTNICNQLFLELGHQLSILVEFWVAIIDTDLQVLLYKYYVSY